MTSFVDYRNLMTAVTHEKGSLRLSPKLLHWETLSSSLKIPSDKIKNLEWICVDKKNKMLKVTFNDKTTSHLRIVGFTTEDEVRISSNTEKYLGHKLSAKDVAVDGGNWGSFVLRHQEVLFRNEAKKTRFIVPYHFLKQAVIQGKNEVSLEFKEELGRTREDSLCEMRIYIPDDDDGEVYKEFHETLVKKADLGSDNSTMICWFDAINFKVPRGKKEIQFYPEHFQFRGDTSSYKIQYSQIRRLFVFEQPDHKVSLLVNLTPPIRQGAQTYGYVIMEFPEDEQCTTVVNATQDQLKTQYSSREGAHVLRQNMEGPTYDIISRVFMGLSKIKIIAAKTFESRQGYRCLQCSYGPNQGLLYPLEKGIFFIWKPVTYVRHKDVDYVQFDRMQDTFTSKLFDFKVQMKNGQKLVFGIDKADYDRLANYVLAKQDIQVANRALHQDRVAAGMTSLSRQTRTRKNLKTSLGAMVGRIQDIALEEDDDEDDEDYDMGQDNSMLLEDEKDDQYFFENTNREVEKLDENLVQEEEQRQAPNKAKEHQEQDQDQEQQDYDVVVQDEKKR